MSIKHLDRLLAPSSVAVIGASDKPHRVGTRVLANLVAGDFASTGKIWPVNPKYATLRGIRCHARVATLPEAPDLAIICTPAATVAGLIDELGARGTRAVIVMTPIDGREQRQALLDAAQPYQLRVLGPASIGLQTPGLGLDASFNHLVAGAGKLALVSQSGALAAAVLDWAGQRGIGFSHVVTLGDDVDVDFGDLLDYLAADAHTEAIALCVEDVRAARKFMSAGRLAARAKPLIVFQPGAHQAADRSADLVFDAAIRRAGMLPVQSMADLFDAVEALGRRRPHHGERLAIMTNSAALALIATAALAAGGMRPAPVSRATRKRLAQHGVAIASSQAMNQSVNLAADAAVELYVAAAQALLADDQTDALLLLHAPTAMVTSAAIAQALAPVFQASGRNLLSCWMGGASAASARHDFANAGLPSFDTPEAAVHGFLHMAHYRRNQAMPMEVPACVPGTAAPLRTAARALAKQGKQGKASTIPSDDEVRSLLVAYDIALATPQQAALIGATPAAVRIEIGIDRVFGPVVFFGQGGLTAAVAADRTAGLPPLNLVLANDMVRRTRVSQLLAEGQTAADAEALVRALVQVADMVTDLPELAQLELDPVLVIGGAVVALGARLKLAAPRSRRTLAIRPYPQELEQTVTWSGSAIVLRPIRPEDAAQHQAFFHALDADDVRLRFFTAMRELPPSQLARLTQIDYERAMAFIATRPNAAADAGTVTATATDGGAETLGVVRAVIDAANQSAEFAIIILSDLKGRGLGYLLFGKLIDYLRSRGTAEIVGDALAENLGVQKLVRHFGGVVLPHQEPGMVRLQLPLQ